MIHAAPGTAAVNVFVDGNVALANIPYQGASSYGTVASGTHTVNIEAAATPGATIASAQPPFNGATDTSIVLTGTTGATTAIVLNDNNLPGSAGRARVRFVNVAPGLGAVDVYVNFAPKVPRSRRTRRRAYTEYVAGHLRNQLRPRGHDERGAQHARRSVERGPHVHGLPRRHAGRACRRGHRRRLIGRARARAHLDHRGKRPGGRAHRTATPAVAHSTVPMRQRTALQGVSWADFAGRRARARCRAAVAGNADALALRTLLERALAHQTAQRLPEAEALYRTVLAREPRQFDALHMLGVVRHQTGDHDGAIDLFRRAIDINPAYAPAHSNLALALTAKRDYPEALASVDRAWRYRRGTSRRATTAARCCRRRCATPRRCNASMRRLRRRPITWRS